MIMLPPSDGVSLREISPVALAAYAQSEGWAKVERTASIRMSMPAKESLTS